MVMHRALFTWFILLLFLILLSLRLEARIHWNWFLIFLPMWFYDVILLIDAVFNIFIRCRSSSWVQNTSPIFKNKNFTLVAVVILKAAAQTVICLKLSYPQLNLTLYHVLIPFWILLSILIADVSFTLYQPINDYIN